MAAEVVLYVAKVLDKVTYGLDRFAEKMEVKKVEEAKEVEVQK